MIEGTVHASAPVEVLPVLFTLAGAHLLSAMSPGANTALLLQATARSRRHGLAAAVGFWPAGVVWSAAGLLGLGQALAALPWAETTFRLACGAYLAWLGLGMIRRAGLEVDGAPTISTATVVRQAFLTNLTNPKSVAYYASVFAATGAYALPAAWQAVAVVTLPSIGFAWYTTLAIAASGGLARGAIERWRGWVDRTAGAVMFLLGLRLIAGR